MQTVRFTRSLGSCLFTMLLALVAVARAQGEIRSLNLVVGDQSAVPALGIKSYSEGTPGVVEVRVPKDGQKLVLVALAPGNTTLLLFMLDGREVQYRINVSGGAEQRAALGVEAKDNIRLDLYFVQVSESYGHQIGTSWPARLGGNGTLQASLDLKSGALATATLGIVDQALPALDLAERSGQARVYRQTAVIAENGGRATFHSGGEVNIPIQGALTAEVRSIEFGSEVSVEPRFDARSGRLELKVGAVVSDLTDDSGTGIPGRQVARLDTSVNLDLGKSLVLAGLDAQSEAKSRRGLAGLARIPILGALFASYAKRSEHTKNLLFIVPSVVQAVAARERSFVEETLKAYRRWDGDVSAVDWPNQTAHAKGAAR